VISSSQSPLPDNTQHSQQTNIHAPHGIRTHNLSRRAAADLSLRPRGHWDRLYSWLSWHITTFWHLTNSTFSNNLHILKNAKCLYDDWFCSGLKKATTAFIHILPNLLSILKITRLLEFFFSLELQKKKETFRKLPQCFSLVERVWRNLLSLVRKMSHVGLATDLWSSLVQCNGLKN